MPSLYRVRYSPAAARDLNLLFAYVEDQAGPVIALDYLARLRRYIEAFETFPKRGSVLKLRRRGVRVVGFERRVAVVFTVGKGEVVILRVISKGRQADCDPSKRLLNVYLSFILASPETERCVY